jgi:DNA-binding XRE family transcriptional regulator
VSVGIARTCVCVIIVLMEVFIRGLRIATSSILIRGLRIVKRCSSLSDETLINRINSLLESRGIKQKELAESIGILPQTFNGYMTDRRKFPVDVIVKVADHFAVTVDYLVGRTNTPN